MNNIGDVLREKHTTLNINSHAPAIHTTLWKYQILSNAPQKLWNCGLVCKIIDHIITTCLRMRKTTIVSFRLPRLVDRLQATGSVLEPLVRWIPDSNSFVSSKLNCQKQKCQKLTWAICKIPITTIIILYTLNPRAIKYSSSKFPISM